jgi:hypothetical protein
MRSLDQGPVSANRLRKHLGEGVGRPATKRAVALLVSLVAIGLWAALPAAPAAADDLSGTNTTAVTVDQTVPAPVVTGDQTAPADVAAVEPAAVPVTYSGYTMRAYREASYGNPPNGLGTPDDYTGSLAGCHLEIVFTFPGAVTVTDTTALGNSLAYTVSGVVFASTATPSTGQTTGPDPAYTTYTPSGNTLTIDTKILYLPGGIINIAASGTTTGGILNGVTAGGAQVSWTPISTVVPTGLTLHTLSVTVGTATAPAATSVQVTQSARVRSMNHVVWLANGASIIDGTSTTQAPAAHHHQYWLFTTATSASFIASASTITVLDGLGYTLTYSGDALTLTAKTAKAGEVLDIKVYDDDFFKATGMTLADHVSGLPYPSIVVAGQTYTGAALTPDLVVAGTAYNPGTSPAASYTDNTALGTAKATVTASGANLSGSTYAVTYNSPFSITAADIAGATIAAIPAQTYTGSALTPALTVTYAGKTLVKDTDFTVAYSNNTAAGTATATITGKGNFTGTKSAQFTIAAATTDIAGATIAAIPAQTYTGSALTPVLTVTFGAKTLVKDTDYTAAYSNNTNVGTATVTITGKGSYTGTKSATFSVTAADIAGATIAAIPAQTHTGSALTPPLTVTYAGKTLVKDADFTVAYSNNTAAGTATATITGKGNFTGTKSAQFTIADQGSGSGIDIAAADIFPIPDQQYTGSPVTPGLWLIYSGDAGTQTVAGASASGGRGGHWGWWPFFWHFRHHKGEMLQLGVDYTVTYYNNVGVGSATAVVTGVGDFSGSATVTFRIVPGRVDITRVSRDRRAHTTTIEWGPGAPGVTGYQVACVTGWGRMMVPVGCTTGQSLVVRGLFAGPWCSYTVRAYADIDGKRCYGPWSEPERSGWSPAAQDRVSPQ